MQQVNWQDYQATYTTLLAARSPDDLIQFNVRVQRHIDKAPILELLWKILLQGKLNVAKLLNEARNQEKDTHAWVSRYLTDMVAESAVTGAIAMLLTTIESTREEDQVAKLKLRIKTTYDLVEKALLEGAITFADPAKFSATTLLGLLKYGL
jgi:hypothetical protein